LAALFDPVLRGYQAKFDQRSFVCLLSLARRLFAARAVRFDLRLEIGVGRGPKSLTARAAIPLRKLCVKMLVFWMYGEVVHNL
jgi:hypothetical protein